MSRSWGSRGDREDRRGDSVMPIKTRKKGEEVEVRVYLGASPMWRRARVLEGFGDGIVIASPIFAPGPTLFARKDVRAPRKRKTTGKRRGTGAPGGWV